MSPTDVIGFNEPNRLTYDDLVAMLPDEDGVRRELIDGELFVMASSFTRHQQLVVRLATSLGSHLDAHPEQGEALLGPFDIVMTPYDVVIPDLTVVTPRTSGHIDGEQRSRRTGSGD